MHRHYQAEIYNNLHLYCERILYSKAQVYTCVLKPESCAVLPCCDATITFSIYAMALQI